MGLDLYQQLTAYGSIYQTSFKLPKPHDFVKWTEDNFNYLQYNPRKNINRYGLSITSLDGGLSGIPDLDSLPEYNQENGTMYIETDFNVPTPVYDYPDLKKILDPIKKYICRTHVLKIGPGGFFPPHRDFRGCNYRSYRLIIPLKNVNPPEHTFIINNTIQYWEPGSVYFVDTALMHYLFNASSVYTYMIVINVVLNQESINFVTHNLKYK